MRLTQKEVEKIDRFIKHKDTTLEQQLGFKPLTEEEFNLIPYLNEEKLKRLVSPPSKKSITVTMKAQYKGRKKSLPYVLEDD